MEMTDDDFTDDTEGMKNLRAAYDKVKAAQATQAAEFAKLAAKDRTRTIADKLTEYGVSTKVAKFVPADVELDKVEEWMTENADVFGFKLGDTTNPDHDAERVAQSRISAITPTGSIDKPDPDLVSVLGAKSKDELVAFIEAAKRGQR